jgi:hypothetical protein
MNTTPVETPTGDGETPAKNLSSEEFLERRLLPPVENSQENPATPPEEEEVLSQSGIEDLSPEELERFQLWAKTNKEGASARIAELVKQRNAERQRAEEALKNVSSDEDPLASKLSPEENPYRNLSSIEELKEKAGELDHLIARMEDILIDESDASADATVFDEDGLQLTKREVREKLRLLRVARKDHLPSQLKVVQGKEKLATFRKQAEAYEAQLEKQLAKDLVWAERADSPQRKKADQMLLDPALQAALPLLREQFPALAAQLKTLVYWAVEGSTRGESLSPTATPKPAVPAMTPPSSPGRNAGEGIGDSDASALKDLDSRFKSSGSTNDWVVKRQKQLLACQS